MYNIYIYIYNVGDAIIATEITSKYPRVHGSPIHLGDPVLIYNSINVLYVNYI